MTDTLWFPRRWPPQDPDVTQLYSMATPNGQKVSICLEETGLDYEAHLIDIRQNDQFDPDYLKLSPNGKIPALLDPHGPEDEPLMLMESIAILTYLADKSDRLLPKTYRARMDHLQWLVFQAAHIGPMLGQFGHFYVFAKDKTADTYAEERYANETRRLLKVLDERLVDRPYLMGEYSIVDIATLPWVDCLSEFYKAGERLQLNEFENVNSWQARVHERPAYQAGKGVCKP